MAQKSVGGVTGVLGGLISNPPPAASEPPAREHCDRDMPIVSNTPLRPGSTPRSRARLGRPVGRVAGQAANKEKLTIRVDAELASTYRDWSWESRCQVGELVQQALRRFLSQRHK